MNASYELASSDHQHVGYRGVESGSANEVTRQGEGYVGPYASLSRTDAT